MIGYRLALMLALLGVGCDRFQVIEGRCYGTSDAMKRGLHVIDKKSMPLIAEDGLWRLNGVLIRVSEFHETPYTLEQIFDTDSTGLFKGRLLLVHSSPEFSKPGYRTEQGYDVEVGEGKFLYVVLLKEPDAPTTAPRNER